MGLAEIKADSKINRQRIAAIDFSKMDRAALAKFIKDEFVENVWPYLEGLVEAAQGEMKALEEAVGELDEAVEVLEDGDDEDALHPETAQQILGVLQLGRQIAIDIGPVLKGGKLDEIKRKKLVKMVAAFRQAVEVVAEIVVAVTVKPDEDAEPGDPANDEAPADGEEDLEDDAAAIDGDEDEGEDEAEADDGFDAPGGEAG